MFLDEGHKVKVTIMFRGREVSHPELGMKILDRVAEHVDGTARVESDARLDGRNMVMVLAPDKRAKQSAAARAAQHDEGPHGHGTGESAAPMTSGSPTTVGRNGESPPGAPAAATDEGSSPEEGT